MTSEPRRAAASALRALNNAFVAHEADPELLEHIAAFAQDAAARLRFAERRDLAPLLAANVGRLFRVDPADETQPSAVNFMTDRAVGGETNPTSAELEFEYADDEVVVRTTLGAAYEGAPGRAHGGMVAALFDDITGFLLPLAGTPAYTGELTIRYRRPVPIETPLEFRTRIDSRQGRKLHVTADCRAGDELVATAEALFIAVDVGQFGKSSG
ncbi:MAG TPA: PaaI family thioesterase [Acidimicrobiales bacterium]|nr:PaaI family thioesterase [Acidimicrobiales bacterium]